MSRLSSSEEGVAAVEFAFCSLLLLILLLGSMEVSLLLMSDRKVTASTSSMVDLAARLEKGNANDFDNIFKAGEIIMATPDWSGSKARLTSIRMENGETLVDWSMACGNFSAYQHDDPINIPADLIEESQTILLAETEYEFDSLFDFIIQGQRTLSDSFYQRPRTVERIELTFAAPSYDCSG